MALVKNPSLGKYISVKDKTSAGKNVYILQLPNEDVISSTNLNNLRQRRTKFLEKNPEYKGRKTYIPELQKPLVALKAELADKKKIKIEDLVELVEKHFKGRYKPDPSPNLNLSDRNVYHYLKGLQGNHPSVFKGTKVISANTEGQDFKKWLLNKVKRAKKPIVTGVTELVEKSGFDVSPSAAAPLIRRDPILNKMITIKEPRIGKGFYDTYHSKSKKFRDWYTKTYDTAWKDLEETKGKRASTYKYNAYRSYQAALKNKPPRNFILTEEFAKKINEKMPVIHQYGRGHDKSAPGQMFKKLFGTTEIKGGKGYLKEPSSTTIEKWNEFQKGEMITDDLAKDVKTLHNKYGDIIKSRGFDLYKDAPIEKVMDKLGTPSPTRAASAMAALGRLYGGVKFRTSEFEDIGPSAKSGERLIKQLGSSTGGRTKYKKAFYNLALKELNKFYKGQGGGSFNTFRVNFLERLQEIIPDHTFNVNEVIPISTGKVRNVAPWSAFIDITQANINQGALGKYGGELSTKIRQVEAALADPKLGTAEAERLAEKLRTTTLGATKKTLAGPKYGLSPEQIKQLNFPEIIVGEKIDRNLYNQAQLDRWKKKGLDIENFAKERGYYFDVKKGTPFWEARQSMDSLENMFAKNTGDVCVIFPRKAAAPGGPITGGCVDQFRKAMQDNPNETLKMISEMPAKGGPWSRIKSSANNIMTKLPKGGRLGMALTAIGAVGAGAVALMPGEAEAEETMHYNATEGKFVKANGDPETQQGVLNWIADHPIISGLAPIPALAVAATKFKKPGLASFPAMVGPMLAAEKLHEYKQGKEGLSMATDPWNAIWAMGWNDAQTTAAKKAYYAALPEAERFGLKKLATGQGWKDLPKTARAGIMSPAARGTKLVMPWGTKWGLGAAKQLAPSGIMRGLGMAARVLPLGPIPLALGAAHFGYQKYADIRDTNVLLDQARASGRMSEEDADTLRTIMKQGWLGTTRLGAKLLGSEELDYKGQTLDLEAQKSILDQMLVDADAFQHGDPERGIEGRDVVRGRSREDVLDFFSDGGRVGLKSGGMDRRAFLKWLAGVTAGAYGTMKGMWKSGAKVAPKEIAEQVTTESLKTGNPEMWIPRLIQKIKTEGKLIEMADKKYVTGDKYEAIINGEKVKLDSNPVGGGHTIEWQAPDYDGEMTRTIIFKEGEWIPPTKAGDKGVKTKPEWEFNEPDRGTPYRDDFDNFDHIGDADETLLNMQKWIGVDDVPVKATGPKTQTFDEESAIWPKDFAEGGEVETGAIARRQSAVPPLSGPNPQGIVALLNQPKQVSIG